MKAVAAITKYFDDPDNGSHKPTVQEMKELSKEDRQELGRLACKELGVEFEPSS